MSVIGILKPTKSKFKDSNRLIDILCDNLLLNKLKLFTAGDYQNRMISENSNNVNIFNKYLL